MIKLKAIKKFSFHGAVIKVGDMIVATKNEAHGLIDRGLAKIYKPRPVKEVKQSEDKMLASDSKKSYRTK